MTKSQKSKAKGFTLIELLVVIAIIAILAAVVFVSLNPVRRFADARNARRWQDVNNLSTAIRQYTVDNNGTLPSGISTIEKQLGTCTSGGATPCTGADDPCLNLSTTLVKYLKSIPKDPQAPSGGTKTYYSVIADSNNIVTVKACNAELSETIRAPASSE